MLYIVRQLKNLFRFYVTVGLNEAGAKVEQTIPSVKEMVNNKEYSKEELNAFKKYLEISEKIGDLSKASKSEVKTIQMLLDFAGKKLSKNPNKDGIDGIAGTLTMKADVEYKNEAKDAIKALRASEKATVKNNILEHSKSKEAEVKKDIDSNQIRGFNGQTSIIDEGDSELPKENNPTHIEGLNGLKINPNLLNNYKTFISIDKKIGGLSNASKGEVKVYQNELNNSGSKLVVDGIAGPLTKKDYNNHKQKALDYIAKAELYAKIDAENDKELDGMFEEIEASNEKLTEKSISLIKFMSPDNFLDVNGDIDKYSNLGNEKQFEALALKSFKSDKELIEFFNEIPEFSNIKNIDALDKKVRELGSSRMENILERYISPSAGITTAVLFEIGPKKSIESLVNNIESIESKREMIDSIIREQIAEYPITNGVYHLDLENGAKAFIPANSVDIFSERISNKIVIENKGNILASFNKGGFDGVATSLGVTEIRHIIENKMGYSFDSEIVSFFEQQRSSITAKFGVDGKFDLGFVLVNKRLYSVPVSSENKVDFDVNGYLSLDGV